MKFGAADSWLGYNSAKGAGPIKKVIYTVNIGNFEPQLCSLTYPLLRAYAKKIGASFEILTERKFPDWPIVYEKLQCYELARDNDWTFCIDSDALIHPDYFDITDHLAKDTVCHNGKDMSAHRFKPDCYFRRDGRWIGSCNWFTVASDWCRDIWHPLDDLTPQEAFENIFIVAAEHNTGYCKREHLIDDYTLSRNIARYGLKFRTMIDILADLGWKLDSGKGYQPFLYHPYNMSGEEKLARALAVLSTPYNEQVPNQYNAQGQPWGVGWAVMKPEEASALRKEWGLNA